MRATFICLLLLLTSPWSHAWWNKDWTHRTRVIIDTTPQGVALTEPVPGFALALRLHSGNFDFVGSQPDGADLRLLAADDKTPLAFRIERWDPTNELAVVWVQVLTLAPGSDKNLVYAYAGNDKARLEPGTASGFDPATLAALHFTAVDGADVIAGWQAISPITLDANGLLGSALRLSGAAAVWPASERVRTAANGALSVSLWVKAEAVERGTLLQQGPLALALQGGRVLLRVGSVTLTGGDVKPGTWVHVAATLGQGKASLYVDGKPVAQGDASTPLIEGDLRLGGAGGAAGAAGAANAAAGFIGSLDAVQLASTVLSPAWLQLAAAAQGIDGKLVRATTESAGEAAGEGGSPGYLGILMKNLTVDAWVVIVICGLMLLIAIWVMVAKTVLVNRADKANRSFLQRFRQAEDDLLELGGTPHPNSSLFALYSAGVRELKKRKVGVPSAQATVLSGASLDAVKAAVDADVVRELNRLNSQMVLLTIAISGGPFLGLFGTVVGVMITFAAIAAAGDVNVNAIAPGIAAALLATVAGLGVAIPALFGYNYLATRIKNISSDMQIFVDEFITRVAETYGAR